MSSLVVKDGLYYALAFTAAGALIGLLFSLVWSLPFFLATAFCLYFFRDPERSIPTDPLPYRPPTAGWCKFEPMTTRADG